MNPLPMSAIDMGSGIAVSPGVASGFGTSTWPTFCTQVGPGDTVACDACDEK